MAALTKATRTVTTPGDAGRYNSGVTVVDYYGTGDTASDVVAAADGYQYLILPTSYISSNAAASEYVSLFSGANEMLRIYTDTNMATNSHLPPVYTDTGAKLAIKKSAAVGAVWVHLEYMKIKPGEYVGVM